MHSKENWDDLRYVLAVAETGSVSGAARNLGVNHATVLRRIAAFEIRHGVEVFNKTARGYAISDDRLRVIDAAREVETAVMAVDRIIKGVQAPLRGVVRVTSTDTFCHMVLPPIMAKLQGQADQLRIELMSTNAHLDLSRMHADITVRPANKLADDLDGDWAGKLGFDVYSTPDSHADRWLGLGGPLAKSVVANWMKENIQSDLIVAVADSFLTVREMAVSGMGQAVLPCVIGDSEPRLVRRRNILPEVSVDIWVASHADLVDVPRIRVVRRLLADALLLEGDRLLGRTAT